MRTFEINKIHIMDFCQISVLILSEFEGKFFFFHQKTINFYSPRNHQKTYGFMMVSVERKVNNRLYCLLLEATFGNDPKGYIQLTYAFSV